jgi:signal transduction histidine kinase
LEEEVAERKRIESRIQQYTKRLEILHDIDQAILAAESLEAITHATIGHVLNTLPCQRVSLILFDFETRDVILLDLSEKKKNEKPVETSFPMEKVSGFDDIFAILNEDSLNVKDDLSTSPLISPILQILQAQDYQSLTIVPIFVKDELIGTLNLMAFSQNAFFTEHQEVGREIANQLGIAINQAHLLSRLRTDQENLQALSQQLLDVQESERRTIARELHDEVGQALTSIGITLEMATSLLPEVRTDSLKQAHLSVVELMERVSKLSLELRPALLDDLGLLPALLWHFDRYAAQTNIQVKFKHSGLEERRFAPEIETAAYRIVQEALTNIARHAQVNEACVTIWYDLNTLGIQVEDKGKGFDASTVMARGSSGGMLGMQERAWLLNGKLTIETARGKGTRLLAELPTTELPKG